MPPISFTYYACPICLTKYEKHREALGCERTGHVARTVYPDKKPRKAAIGEPHD